MDLKILVPFQVFAQRNDVVRIIAETGAGSLGLLPHRLDCVAALVPGILTYETIDTGTTYLAVDEGVLVKAGAAVLISVRRAIAGTNLALLHESVQCDFMLVDQQHREMRAAIARMEASLLGRFAEFRHGR